MMNLIDVTLRDGGHQVKFDWSDNFVDSHITALINTPSINFIEMGYWKQTSKYSNKFYNLNENHLQDIALRNNLNNFNKFCIMIDYHYSKHVLEEYPNKDFGLGMVRLASKSEYISKSFQFAEKLKNRTESKISINFVNIANYDEKTLKGCVELASNSGVDFIYLADTHGSIDLEKEYTKYSDIASLIKSYNITPGFHLHDHSGKAYFNYRNLLKCGFSSTDVSLFGMGKGGGNLRLENVISVPENLKILDHLKKYNSVLRVSSNPYSYNIISSHLTMTDQYALKAMQLGIEISDFYSKVKFLEGLDKDNYSEEVLMP